VLLTVFNVYITISSEDWIWSAFDIEQALSIEFRLSVLCIAFVNGVITFFYEKIFIWYLSIWWKNKKERKRELEYNKEIEIQAQQVKERAFSKAKERAFSKAKETREQKDR
jgi:hypothetical protein